MPLFEYECAKCKSTFELLISGDSSGTIKCPQCSSTRVSKLFSCFSLGARRQGESADGGTSGACSTCTTKNCSSCG